jgi:DUF1009 family protein
MQPGAANVVGILAGGGALPREIADAVRDQGQRVVIVGLEGEADPTNFGSHDVTMVNWGQIGRMIRTFKSRDVTDLVIVGRVTRPDLMRLKTDFGFYRSLPRIFRIVAAGGDDNVLRRVVRFFEGHGFTVRGPDDVAPELVIGEGPLGRHRMSARHADDVALGLDIVARLAPFDVGQAAIVEQGRVLAIEAVEGTDAMLRRIAKLREARGGAGGVLVKRPKPGQELRVDMPAIGPNTVARAAEAGLAGLAVAAGATLAAERADLVRSADECGVFVSGIALPAVAGRTKLSITADAADEDAGIGSRLLAALRPDLDSRGTIVVRRHVLAVETGEGVNELLMRAAGLRQWGRRLRNRRRGSLVLASLADLGELEIAASAAAGYAHIVALSDGGTRSERQGELTACARHYGIALSIAKVDRSGRQT